MQNRFDVDIDKVGVDIDKLYTDKRFHDLIAKLKNEQIALGALVNAWFLAKRFWLPEKKPIPHDKWLESGLPDSIIEVGLAHRFKDGIKLRGIKKRYEWWFKAQDQRREAGRRSAQARLAKYGSSAPVLNKRMNDRSQNQEKKRKAKTEQNQLVLRTDVNENERTAERVQPVIAKYCELWKSRYGSNPPVGGRVAGQIKLLVRDHGEAKAIAFIEAYMKMPDPWFIKRRHDIATLMQNINAVEHFRSSGRVITTTEANQIDKAVANKNTLDALRRGEL